MMMVGNKVLLQAVVIAGSICLFAGLSHASDASWQVAPAGGDKQTPPSPAEDKQAAPPLGGDKQTAPSPAKDKPAEPAGGKITSAKPIEIFYTWLEPTGALKNDSSVLMAFRDPDAKSRLKVVWWLPQEMGGNLQVIDEVLRKALYSQFSDDDDEQKSLNKFRQALQGQQTQQDLLSGPLYRVGVKYVTEAHPKASIPTTGERSTTWNSLFDQSSEELRIFRVETKTFGQIKIAAPGKLLLFKRATFSSDNAEAKIVIDLEAAAVELLAAMAQEEGIQPKVVDLRFLSEWDVRGECASVKQHLDSLLSKLPALGGIAQRKKLLPVILRAGAVPGGAVSAEVNSKPTSAQWTLKNQTFEEAKIAEIVFNGKTSARFTQKLGNAAIPACGQAQLSLAFLGERERNELPKYWRFSVDPVRIKPGDWRLTITQKESKPRIAAVRASAVDGSIEIELERLAVPWLSIACLALGSAVAIIGFVWWRKKPRSICPKHSPAPVSSGLWVKTTDSVKPNLSKVGAPPAEAAKPEAEAVETGKDAGETQAPPPVIVEVEPSLSEEARQQLDSLREEQDKVARELRETEDRYVSAAGESARLRKELTDLKEELRSQRDELATKIETIKKQRRDLGAKGQQLADTQLEKKRLSTEVTKLTTALETQKSENAKLQEVEKNLNEKVKAWQGSLREIGSNPEEIAKRWDREIGWHKSVTEALHLFFDATATKEATAALKERSPEGLSKSLDVLGNEFGEGRKLVEEILRDMAKEQGADDPPRQVPGTDADELRLIYRKLQQQRDAIERVRKLNPRVTNVVWVLEAMRQLGKSLAGMASAPGARILKGTLLEPAPLATALQGIVDKSDDRWNEMLRTVAGPEFGSTVTVERDFEGFLDWFLDGERLQTLTNILRLGQVVRVYCEGAAEPEIEELHDHFIVYYDECVELQKRFEWIGVRLAPISFLKPPKVEEGWAFHENGDGHPLIFESHALKKLAVRKAVVAGEDVSRIVGDVSTWGFHCDAYQGLRSDTRGWLCRGWRTL